MVYFDNAASTPLDKRVLDAMMPFWMDDFGNPSSGHSAGQRAKKVLEEARGKFAGFLSAGLDEIVFTSGATESDNFAIKGVIKGILFEREKDCICCKAVKPHIITLKIEHHAVLKPVEELEKMGMAETTFLSVESDGIVDVQKVKVAIKDNTRLISIMYVNNEIGTIQPIKEIAEIIKKENEARDEKSKIFFHTDAAQGYCLDMNVQNLGVDLLSFSAHKFYGPKGAGIFYIKKGVPFIPIINGGMQEFGKRAGTPNIPAIAGAAKAVELIDLGEFKRVKLLKEELVKRVLEREMEEGKEGKEGGEGIEGVELNGDLKNTVAGIANFRFEGVEGEALMMLLSDAGFAVSTGSACTTGTSAVSYVLEDLGLSPRAAHSSIRVSLGRQNTLEEVKKFVEALKVCVGKLRKIAGK